MIFKTLKVVIVCQVRTGFIKGSEDDKRLKYMAYKDNEKKLCPLHSFHS